MTRLVGASDPAAWAGTVDRWAALAHPYQTAYARLRLAEAILGVDGDRAAVAKVLSAAHESASAIGAIPLRVEIESLAARARIDLGTVGPGYRHRSRAVRPLPLASAVSCASFPKVTPIARSAIACSSARRP